MVPGTGGAVTIEQIAVLVPKSTDRFSLSTPTWGSGTSESIVYAAINACKDLSDTLAKYLQSTPPATATWKSIVAAAARDKADLSATANHYIYTDGGSFVVCCAAACTAEIDVLTGEYHILSAHLYYDCGVSLNPAVDMGQVEGSFVQGAGMCLTEEQVFSKADGRVVTNGTWEYKPPTALDIPIDFNVTFIPSVNQADGNVLGSKASGEPAVLLGCCPYFALKNAIHAVHVEADAATAAPFRLDCPATPERVQLACKVGLGN